MRCRKCSADRYGVVMLQLPAAAITLRIYNHYAIRSSTIYLTISQRKSCAACSIINGDIFLRLFQVYCLIESDQKRLIVASDHGRRSICAIIIRRITCPEPEIMGGECSSEWRDLKAFKRLETGIYRYRIFGRGYQAVVGNKLESIGADPLEVTLSFRRDRDRQIGRL